MKCHAILALIGILGAAPAAQATILTFNKSNNTNQAIDSVEPNYGDFENGSNTTARLIGNGWTPNTQVDWGGLNQHGAPALQWYDDVVEWDGAQLDGVPTGGGHFDILFTPNAGYGVRLNSFDFDDYADFNGNTGTAHTFDWSLRDAGNNVLFGATGVTVPADPDAGDNDHLTINTGMTDYHAGALRLRITPQNVGENPEGDRAIDNLNFDQAVVPEPVSASLLALGGVALLRRRGR
jgi:hypothetical protein